MRRVQLLLWPLSFLVGFAAELPQAWSEGVRLWLPDLLTGWCVLGCGLLAVARRPKTRTGPLLIAAGAAWFLGSVAPGALYVPRALLFHVTLSYPTGRLKGRLERATIAAGYGIALVPPMARDAPLTVSYGLLVTCVAVGSRRHSVGPERKARRWTVTAVVALAAVLVAVAALRVLFPTVAVLDATLAGYQSAISLLSVALVVGLVRRPWDLLDATTDLVVELVHTRSGALRDALAGVLGDPTLELGFWDASTRSWIGPAGQQLLTPAVGSGRRSTTVEREGEPVALLVHDAAVVDDPALVRAVQAAARLLETNARLQAQVRSQVNEVERSRRRLVVSEGEARRILAHELREGVERRLGTVKGLLAAAVEAGSVGSAAIGRVEQQLERTEAVLHELAAGLDPDVLLTGGLEAAVNRLAESSSLSVTVRVGAGAMRSDVAAAVYFVCSEALVNVAKHARAACVSVTVRTTEDVVLVEVVDDGVGGAAPRQGSGLEGLRDRVAAFGGTLSVDDRPEGGTALTAAVPLLVREEA